ncbi:hypothetical protein [Kiloniella laminariae]|uniref:hypothetical protein n=1 Tax=Kiloniella laminariae TaxID=454162 RepID=UPI0012FB97B6|nr:hypothetical protein [Kiloniella laminariae]
MRKLSFSYPGTLCLLSFSILMLNQANSALATEAEAKTETPAAVWADAAKLQHWDQCGADYTPPAWCSDLPVQIDVANSFSEYRDTLAENKQAEAQRLLEAAKLQEKKIGASKNIKSGVLYKQDLEAISKQANSGDKDAMELMAWMYVQGMMPKTTQDMDPKEAAYIWYGRAYLSGAKEAKENMDKIWPTLNVTQQRRITALFDKK